MSRFSSLPNEVWIEVSKMLDWSGILSFMDAITDNELEPRLKPFLSKMARA
jgi:hypothetical protein